MSKAEYALLQDVIMDADFPDLDLALRRGRHIDRDDAAWYSLLTDAQELLEPFYRRYGCELIHKTDGYFYLLPTGEKVSRKQLSPTDMLVGQALALLYLEPAAVERGGVVSQEDIVGQLSAVLGSDALIGLFSPGKRKKQDERIAQRNVRQRVAEAVRRLAGLGFVELSDATAVRLRAALLRFAEPVRGLSEPAEALAKLVAQGEVALTPEAGDELEESDEERAEGEGEVDGEDADAGEPRVLESSHRELRPSERSETAAIGGDRDLDALSATPEVGVPAAESGDAGDLGTPHASEAADSGDDVAAEPTASAAHGRAIVEAESGAGATSVVAPAAASGADALAAPDALADDAAPAVELDPAADSGAAWAADARLAAEESDESALRDDWDESSGSGVVARPDAEGAREDADATEPHAHGAEPEPPAKPAPAGRQFTPPADEDLDWADILLPGQDAEDGS